MQVDPQQQAAASIVVMQTPDGGELELQPGRTVVARVVAFEPEGIAQLSLAGQQIQVRSATPLMPGDEIRLAVTKADASGVQLALVEPPASARSMTGGETATQRGTNQLVTELARAGVPVTPRVAQVAARVIEQLGGQPSDVRAVASLAGRDLPMQAPIAARVTAALDLAGSIGPALDALARRSPTVAAALPGQVPAAASLPVLLSGQLAPVELAVARIAQASATTSAGAAAAATTPAPTAAGVDETVVRIVQALQRAAPGVSDASITNPPRSTPQVVQNFVASQLAGTQRLDQLGAASGARGVEPDPAVVGGSRQPPRPDATGPSLAGRAMQAVLQGTANAMPAAAVPAAALPQDPTLAARFLPGMAAVVPDTPDRSAAPATPLTGAPAAPAMARPAAAVPAARSAAAAATAIVAEPTNTSAPVARAVADLASLATRFAPAVAPGAGAMGTTASTAARGTNVAEVAQQAGRPEAAAARGASVAGSGPDGDAAPLVAAVRSFLAAPTSKAEAEQLLRSVAMAGPGQLALTLRELPESQSLRLAGALLELLSGAALPREALERELRQGVYQALHQLGLGLRDGAPTGNDLTMLRAALEHVVEHDPRPAVSSEAARILAAQDGQALLSRPAAGADPGFVYFQVPLPEGRGAEVLVRRDPARRAVSFDEFSAAFLLHTEHVGTLLIHLEAHPASLRADVRTDQPDAESLLRDHVGSLIEPLGTASRRSVTVTSGLFDHDPPMSLLDEQGPATSPEGRVLYA